MGTGGLWHQGQNEKNHFLGRLLAEVMDVSKSWDRVMKRKKDESEKVKPSDQAARKAQRPKRGRDPVRNR